MLPNFSYDNKRSAQWTLGSNNASLLKTEGFPDKVALDLILVDLKTLKLPLAIYLPINTSLQEQHFYLKVLTSA